MKQHQKRLLAVLLALCLLTGLSALTASAWYDDYDLVSVETEEELLNALAGDTAIIMVESDIQLSDTLRIERSVELWLYAALSYEYNGEGDACAIRVGNGEDEITLMFYGDENITVTGSCDGTLTGLVLTSGSVLDASDLSLGVENAVGSAVGLRAEGASVAFLDYAAFLVRAAKDATAIRIDGSETLGQTQVVDGDGNDLDVDDIEPNSALFVTESFIQAIAGPDGSAAAVRATASGGIGDPADAGQCVNLDLHGSSLIAQTRSELDGEPVYSPGTAVSAGAGVLVNVYDYPDYYEYSYLYGALDVAEAGREDSGIRGGYFSEDPGEKGLLNTGYTVLAADAEVLVYYEDSTRKLPGFAYQAVPDNIAARIGMRYYDTLQAAFDDAGDSNEIGLIGSKLSEEPAAYGVALPENVVVPGYDSESFSALRLALNLNGRALTQAQDTDAALIVGDGDPLALTIRDKGETPLPCTVPIVVLDNSYLTIQSGKFDVWPVMENEQANAEKHIFIAGGSFAKSAVEKEVLQRFVVSGGIQDDGDYWTVAQLEQTVLLAIGDTVAGFDTASKALAYLNEQAERGPVKAILSISGPALITEDAVLGENVDLTCVYSYNYNQSCLTGAEGFHYTLTIDGARITAGDTVYPPYALALNGVDLVVNSGEIRAAALSSARKDTVTAIKMMYGSVTLNGGRIVADGRREYPGRDRKDDDSDYVEYELEGENCTVAIWDNRAVGVKLDFGSVSIGDGVEIVTLGSYAEGVWASQNNDRVTMTGGRITALAYRHPGTTDSYRLRDVYQWAYGIQADGGAGLVASVSGGEIVASGTSACGVTVNSGTGSLAIISGGTIAADATRTAYGVRSTQSYITGGEISAVCDTVPGKRSHYNAVGVLMDNVMTSATVDGTEYFPTVSGAKVSATAKGDGEACGLFFQYVYSKLIFDEEAESYTRYYASPVVTVENCAVSAVAEGPSFACAVNNYDCNKTIINSGSFTSTANSGFADCVCAFYSGDLEINGGSFTVQAGTAGSTSSFSSETYAATCVYNQGDGDTVIRGGSFRMLDETGSAVLSSEHQGTGKVEGEEVGLFRLLRVQNPAPRRYDLSVGDYVYTKDPTLTVYGGRYGDKISLLSPKVLAEGYEVRSTGNMDYPWTVGKTVPVVPAAEPSDAATVFAPRFADVPENAYYYEAVAWAVERGVAAGTDETHFSPDAACTRAQAVTFLWRAAGSPEPTQTETPFTDVAAGSYYEKAVSWAVENGIVKGTSETTFSPDKTVTRAQAVAFLYRYAKAETEPVKVFEDVDPKAWYAGAVTWAAEQEIARGASGTAFSPDADCVRSQIVSFLYRLFA